MREVWHKCGTVISFGDGGIDIRNAPDAESRARLIASAPQLLEALESIVSAHQFDINDNLLAQAKSAIAAAKGQ